MAKIKIRPRPGILSDLLKKKGMTQMDASAKTHVDRKTLLKIERGEEVKQETLQQVASGLQVADEYFHHPSSAEDSDQSNVPLVPEPGSITLRKLDATRLEELLAQCERVHWKLNAAVSDIPVRKFLEEFEQIVERFREYVSIYNLPDELDPPSLKGQLDRRKTADEIAASLKRLSEHRLALLGGHYLFWNYVNEECPSFEDGMRINRRYSSDHVTLLSVEPIGTQSRRERVYQGDLPPKFAPDIDTFVFVNGLQLAPLRGF